MRTVKSLIDEAAEMCGGQAKLAARIGVDRARVTHWQTGAEPISPESVGLLCDVLGVPSEEARRLAALAVLERAKPARKEALRRAFFLCLALGGAAIGLTATTGSGDPRQPERVSLYIVLCVLAGARLKPRFAAQVAIVNSILIDGKPIPA